jgi:glutathione S-transferase
MKLYTFPTAPNPRRLHIFLAEKGITLPSEAVDLMQREQLGEAYRAANPLCTVPALVTDEGVTLGQVIAICTYLEELHPEPPLLGRTPIEKALVREWCHRLFIEGLLSIADVFRNGSPAFEHRALPGPVDVEQIPALVERGMQMLGVFWRTLDAHLAGRDYIVGDSLTMADIDAVVVCDFARWIRQSIPEQCGNIRRWHGALSKRESFKAGTR